MRLVIIVPPPHCPPEYYGQVFLPSSHFSSQYFKDASLIFKYFSPSVYSTLIITYVDSLEILTTVNTLEVNACLLIAFHILLNLMVVWCCGVDI